MSESTQQTEEGEIPEIEIQAVGETTFSVMFLGRRFLIPVEVNAIRQEQRCVVVKMSDLNALIGPNGIPKEYQSLLHHVMATYVFDKYQCPFVVERH